MPSGWILSLSLSLLLSLKLNLETQPSTEQRYVLSLISTGPVELCYSSIHSPCNCLSLLAAA